MKIIFTTCLVIFSAFVWEAKADDFVAKIDRFAMESGYGTPYVEIIFKDLSSGTMTSTYYALVLEDNPSFPYLFAMLNHAKTRNKLIRVYTSGTWTRGDGADVFLKIQYVEYVE